MFWAHGVEWQMKYIEAARKAILQEDAHEGQNEKNIKACTKSLMNGNPKERVYVCMVQTA